jgi:hypothetical protein
VHNVFLSISLRALGATVADGGGDSLGSLPYVEIAGEILGTEGRAAEVLLAAEDFPEHLERLLVLRRPSDADLQKKLPEVRGLHARLYPAGLRALPPVHLLRLVSWSICGLLLLDATSSVSSFRVCCKLMASESRKRPLMMRHILRAHA